MDNKFDENQKGKPEEKPPRFESMLDDSAARAQDDGNKDEAKSPELLKGASQTSEEGYRHLFETAGDAIMIADAETGIIIDANKRAEQLMGYTRKELIGMHRSKLHPTKNYDDKTDYNKHFMQHIEAGGVNNDHKVEIIRKDGTIVPISLSASVTELNGRKVNQGIFRNDTERKHTEEHLYLMAAMLDTAPTAIFIHDFNGKFIYANHKASKMHGYEVAEFLALPLQKLDVPETAALIAARMQLIMEKGETQFEANHIRKDGTVFPLDVFVKAVQWQGVPAILSINTDITERKKAETTLMASEMKFKDLVETTSDWIWELDINGKYTYSSPRIKDVLGYGPEEIIGKTPFDFISKDEAEKIIKMFEESIKTKKPFFGLENWNVHKNKTRVLMETSGIPILDKNGDLVGYRGIDRDITERKKAEQKIVENERRFREVLENASDVSYKRNMKTNAYEYLSPVFTRISGYTPDEMNNMPLETIMGLMHPDDSVRIGQEISNAMAGPAGTTYQMEYRFKHKDGQYRWFNDKFVILADTDRQNLALIGSVSDITERKKLEIALKTSDGIFTMFMKHSPMMVYIKDENHRLVKASETLGKLIGKPVSELIGKTTLEIMPPGLAEQADSDDENVLKINNVVTKEEYLNGRTFITIKFPVHLEGRPTYLGGITIDITDRKQAEEQLMQAMKMESIGILAAGIAHDFNNALGAILGCAEFIKEDVDSGKFSLKSVSEDINEVISASNRAKNLTQQLLGFARQGKYNPKITNLSELFTKEKAFLKKGFSSTIHYDLMGEFNAKCCVNADETQMQQMFQNLVLNARDSMSNGGTITVKTDDVEINETTMTQALAPGKYVKLAILDAGTGISKENITKIFDPFFTTKEKGKGTGLGLSMVWGIVKSHRGHIQVDSTEGKGTTFEVYLPIVDGVQEKTAEETRKQMQTHGNVLIVDDEEHMTRLAERCLKRGGHDVRTASNGRKALDIYREGGIDLVITDLIMPGMNGIELFEQIRKMNPNAKICIMSGYFEDERVQDVMKQGAREFIAKPFKLRDLEEMVERQLTDKRAEDRNELAS